MDRQHRHPRFLAIGDFSLGRSSGEGPGKGSAARKGIGLRQRRAVPSPKKVSARSRVVGGTNRVRMSILSRAIQEATGAGYDVAASSPGWPLTASSRPNTRQPSSPTGCRPRPGSSSATSSQPRTRRRQRGPSPLSARRWCFPRWFRRSPRRPREGATRRKAALGYRVRGAG